MTLAGSSPMADQMRLPTRDAADKDVEDGEAKLLATHDANDVIYAVAASSDYDPSPTWRRSTRPVLVREQRRRLHQPPPELGLAQTEIKRIKTASSS